MTTKYQVPERKPSEWELKQKAKPKKVIRNSFGRNKWATPLEKQGMFAKKKV